LWFLTYRWDYIITLFSCMLALGVYCEMIKMLKYD
jgi:hypothetical protein